MTTRILRRLWPGARRVARRLAPVALALGLVLVARALLGVWAVAGLVALAVTAGLIAGWAAVEARAFPSRTRSAEFGPRGPGPAPGDHVAFARTLTAVAAAYLSHCKAQERDR